MFPRTSWTFGRVNNHSIHVVVMNSLNCIVPKGFTNRKSMNLLVTNFSKIFLLSYAEIATLLFEHGVKIGVTFLRLIESDCSSAVALICNHRRVFEVCSHDSCHWCIDMKNCTQQMNWASRVVASFQNGYIMRNHTVDM